MAEAIRDRGQALQRESAATLLRQEDWWAIWIGLGLVVAAVLLAANGSSIKWVAVAPTKWSTLGAAFRQLSEHASQYAALFVLWSVLLGIGASALGYKLSRFLPAFALVYGVTLILYFLGQWDQASHYNLEPPLVALALGLLISNTVGAPKWADAGLRVEFYIKTGIVLLGAGVPLALIAWAGPVAILQAGIVSLATFGVIYFTGVKLGLDRRLAATLGTGGAVCGVSGAIATAGAVGAKREHASIAISLVIFWAIVTIFVLPLAARALSLPTGVAGAWIGTSEFADAAGLAAAQAYGGYAGHVPGIEGTADAAVNSFTLMKVIGRDVWIGVWAFVLAIVATTKWERTGIESKPSPMEIWRRFPKFVLGFLIASAIITIVAHGYSYADYKKIVQPTLVAPLQALRTWAFTFAFLAIGLTTRFREFVSVGSKPFYAFTTGVVINIVLGYVLSTQVFVDFWTKLGQ
ncbi:MAG TPA: putative sulfate exporter family transporter [Steroidobacteraceae bacterium]|nr:putative sulfate exporter family transporter [Steroidobacteraceae bacterium]